MKFLFFLPQRASLFTAKDITIATHVNSLRVFPLLFTFLRFLLREYLVEIDLTCLDLFLGVTQNSRLSKRFAVTSSLCGSDVFKLCKFERVY